MTDTSSSDVIMQVVMDPVMGDFARFAEIEDDAIFEHAVALAQCEGVDVGDVKFDDIFRTVQSARQDAMQWSYYLAFVSLATIKVLLETGDLELRIELGTPEEMAENLAKSLSKASMTLLSAILHVVSGPDSFWIENPALAAANTDARSVTFEFQQVGVVRGDS